MEAGIRQRLTRDPDVLAPDIGDTLHFEPVVVSGEGFLDDVVKVSVVGEDDVTSNVKEEALSGNVGRGETACLIGGVDEEPVLAGSRARDGALAVELVKPLGGTETGRSYW